MKYIDGIAWTTLYLFMFNFANSQQVECYSIESASINKEHVKTLILNLNDTMVLPSLEGVGSLTKLETLIVFPVSSTIYGPFKLKDLNDSIMVATEYYYDTFLTNIPEEIGNCRELRVLKLNEARINHLPESLNNLKNLEVLELALSKVDEKELLSVCHALKRLKILNIYGCDLSEEAVQKLRTYLPQCQIIVSMSDYLNMFPKPPLRHGLFITTTERLLTFETEQLALQFFNSLPLELIEKMYIYYQSF